MKSELNKKTSEFEVIIPLEKSVWKQTQQEVEKGLIKNLEVKGFRKGKAPLDIARKSIAKSQVLQKSVEKALPDLAKEAAKHIPKEILILSGPSYTINKISDADLEIKLLYPVYPQFSISDYKNLEIKYKENKVDNKTIDLEIEKMKNSQSMLKTKKGTIDKGDVAIFDFQGFVDGKEFKGGSSQNFQLEIGSQQFIPGFEEQMIGLKSGDAKDIKVKFPDEYHEKTLCGKPAVFKVKINDVKSKEIPKLNDDFVKSAGIPKVENVDGLKEYFKNLLTEQEKQKSRAEFQRIAFDKITKDTKDIVVPNSLINQEINSLYQKFEEQLKQQNINIAQYLEMTKMDKEKMDHQFKMQAETRLKDSLIFAEIAKLEKIQLKDEDYEKEYKKLAKVYGQLETSLKSQITKEQMQIPMTNDRVINKLIEYNKK